MKNPNSFFTINCPIKEKNIVHYQGTIDGSG
jgi:hypothetical protein